MSEALDHLLSLTADTTAVLSEKRMTVRTDAIQAARAIVARVGEALSGEMIRGMPNLMPDGEPFHGVRINSWGRHGSGGFLPRDGREVLVLVPSGKLQAASYRLPPHEDRPRVGLRDVTDEELVLEDLEPLVRVVQEALEKHVALVDKRMANLTKVEALAKKIIDAIGLEIR